MKFISDKSQQLHDKKKKNNEAITTKHTKTCTRAHTHAHTRRHPYIHIADLN